MKLKTHGVKGKLNSRKQNVQINSKKFDLGRYKWSSTVSVVLLLFMIYNNDSASRISSDVSKVVDGTKVGWLIQFLYCVQDEQDSLHEWAEKWQLDFSVGNCSILRVGKNDPFITLKWNSHK